MLRMDEKAYPTFARDYRPDGMRLFALAENQTRREVELEGCWPHKNGLVLKFAGIDSITEAESLVGCELQVPSQARAELEAGWSYVSDSAGVKLRGVYRNGRRADALAAGDLSDSATGRKFRYCPAGARNALHGGKSRRQV